MTASNIYQTIVYRVNSLGRGETRGKEQGGSTFEANTQIIHISSNLMNHLK